MLKSLKDLTTSISDSDWIMFHTENKVIIKPIDILLKSSYLP